MVTEVADWLETPYIVIRSTVPPGTTESLRQRVERPVVFWPEYSGEWTHMVPWEHSVRGWPFVLLGGRPDDTRPLVPWLASVLGPDRTYRQADARTVELCKYMENCWLAGQVLFANEFARIAEVMEIDYWELREMWALDPRVSRHHTAVFSDSPGFGGNCLPKDVAAIVAASSPLVMNHSSFGHSWNSTAFSTPRRPRRRRMGDRPPLTRPRPTHEESRLRFANP